MIKNPLLAEKYARALYDATEGKADIVDLTKQVAGVDPESFKRPSLSYDALVGILGSAPAASELKNLLKLLCRRKRHWLLPELLLAYEMRVEKARGIARASVTSPVELDGATREKLEALVVRISEAESVRLDLSVDPDLLSGFVVRVGDNLIDASGRSRLENFRRRF